MKKFFLKKPKLIWIIAPALLYLAIFTVGEKIVEAYIVPNDQELQNTVERLREIDEAGKTVEQNEKTKMRKTVAANSGLIFVFAGLILLLPVLLGAFAAHFSRGGLEGILAVGLGAVLVSSQAEKVLLIITWVVISMLLGGLGALIVWKFKKESLVND